MIEASPLKEGITDTLLIMSIPDFWDFMMEGGDELLNIEECPHCGHIIYLDQKIE